MKKSGFVAIIGRPNAGKSTLLNTILGVRVSIVTPKAQTTRERVLGILNEKEGQIVFVDTPGIHRAKDGGINAFMMEEARVALEEPTVIWYLLDPSSAVKHEQSVTELLAKSKAPVFLLMNKMDVVRGNEWKEKTYAFLKEMEQELKSIGVNVVQALGISAVDGTDVSNILGETWKLLSEGPLFYPDEEQISDRPMRYFAGEKIREQLLLQLGEELPYSCAVEIEKFEDPKAGAKKPITRIEAMIHVERESQKGMVIGKKGAKIKEIGQAARQEIETFIGGPVFLGLRVRVNKDWSRNKEALKRMGYHIPERKKAVPKITKLPKLGGAKL